MSRTQTPSSSPRRPGKILISAIAGGLVLIFLLIVLSTGSLLFSKGAAALCSSQGGELRFQGGSLRPLGRFAFSSWSLSRNGRVIFHGGALSGSYFLSPGKKFSLSLQGKNLESGPAFPDIFPAHHEKIPSVELHDFSFRSNGKGLTREEILDNLHSELNMNIRNISLESSELCRKIHENTGVRLDRYLKFDSGRLRIEQDCRKLTVRSPEPLTGPYQILGLDGQTNLDTEALDLKLIFSLQPRLARKIRSRNFFRHLIPENWDGESPISLPAPIILTGTLSHPRLDVGEIFRRRTEDPRQKPRVRIQLKRKSGSRKYQVQIP